MRSKSLRLSIVAQVVLALYFQAIVWLPLGKWNYQPGSEPLLRAALQGHLEFQDVFISVLFLLPAVLFWVAHSKNQVWLMWIGLVGYTIWLFLQIQTWWVGYIFGASDRWAEVYQRAFSESTKILPSFGRHLAPDGVHFVLQLLLMVVVISTTVALLRLRQMAMEQSSHQKR